MSSGSQTARQQARRQVGEKHAARLKEFEKREKELAAAAVEVVAALVAQDRARDRAAESVRSMAALGLTAVEIADRCGISRQHAIALKNTKPADNDQESGETT